MRYKHALGDQQIECPQITGHSLAQHNIAPVTNSAIGCHSLGPTDGCLRFLLRLTDPGQILIRFVQGLHRTFTSSGYWKNIAEEIKDQKSMQCSKEG